MTASKHSPLVERAAKAIAKADGYDSKSSVAFYMKHAQAALAACHAEEMREELQANLAVLASLQLWMKVGLGSVTLPKTSATILADIGARVAATEALLAKLDGKP